MALKQPTFMSSERFHDADCLGGCPSSNSVDGDRSTTVTRCSHTNKEDNPWWAVELLRDDKNIAKVVVTNRNSKTYGRK